MSSKARQSRISSPKSALKNSLRFSSMRGICLANKYYKSADLKLQHQPWRYLVIPLDVKPIEISERGFITGQKLSRHKMDIISSPLDDIFPRCWGFNTILEKKYLLWPQNGDLTHHFVGPKTNNGQETLQRLRNQLNREMDGKVNTKTNEVWKWIQNPAPKIKEEVIERRVFDEEAWPAWPALSNQAMAEAIQGDLEIIEERRKVRRDKRRKKRSLTETDAAAYMALELNGIEQSEK